MQNFTDIPSTRTLSDSLAEILNNDKTALSLSSGTAFPTTNLQLGMPCYRSDQQKLYILTQVSPSAVWKLWMDFSGSEGKAPNAEAVDGVDSSAIVQNTRQIIAGTGLSGGGDLSANRTLSLAAGAAAANLGYTPVNKAGDTITGGLGIGAPATRLLSVEGAGAEFSLVNTAVASGTRVFNIFISGGMAHLRMLNDAQSAGNTAVSLDPSGRVMMPFQPAFFAGKNNGDWTGTCLFNDVRLNIGSHYNSSTGRFTAPVTGRYFFAVNALSANNNSTGHKFFQIRINGSSLVDAYTYITNGGFYLMTRTFVCQMSSGDYIDVTGGDGAFYGQNTIHTNFSGHLLS